MLSGALYKIARKWNQAKRPPTNERVVKTWHTYTTEYYLAGNKNKIMKLQEINLEHIELREVTKLRKQKVHVLPHMQIALRMHICNPVQGLSVGHLDSRPCGP